MSIFQAVASLGRRPDPARSDFSLSVDSCGIPPEEPVDPSECLTLGSGAFQCLPPQGHGPISASSAASRRAVEEIVTRCYAQSRASSTVATYESLLRRWVPLFERELSIFPLLPLSTSKKVRMVLAAAVHLGPKIPGSRGDEPRVRWAFIRQLCAALGAWHVSRKKDWALPSVRADDEQFWKGLKIQCSHVVTSKVPMTVAQVRSLLSSVAFEPTPEFSRGTFSKVCAERSWILRLRLAASVAIAFFGIRRLSEVLALRMCDVSVHPSGLGLLVTISSQKNDRLGVGMTAVIPKVALWKEACPVAIILKWKAARVKCLEQDGVPPEDFVNTRLVVNLANNSYGTVMSTSSAINAVRAFFEAESTPSARKGGTQYYVAAGADQAFTQTQGGWRSEATMNRIYKALDAVTMLGLACNFSEISVRHLTFVSSLQQLSALRLLDVPANSTLPPAIRDDQVNELTRVVARLYKYRASMDANSILLHCPDFGAIMDHLLGDIRCTGECARRLTAMRQSWTEVNMDRIEAQHGAVRQPRSVVRNDRTGEAVVLFHRDSSM